VGTLLLCFFFAIGGVVNPLVLQSSESSWSSRNRPFPFGFFRFLFFSYPLVAYKLDGPYFIQVLNFPFSFNPPQKSGQFFDSGVYPCLLHRSVCRVYLLPHRIGDLPWTLPSLSCSSFWPTTLSLTAPVLLEGFGEEGVQLFHHPPSFSGSFSPPFSFTGLIKRQDSITLVSFQSPPLRPQTFAFPPGSAVVARFQTPFLFYQ